MSCFRSLNLLSNAGGYCVHSYIDACAISFAHFFGLSSRHNSKDTKIHHGLLRSAQRIMSPFAGQLQSLVLGKGLGFRGVPQGLGFKAC